MNCPRCPGREPQFAPRASDPASAYETPAPPGTTLSYAHDALSAELSEAQIVELTFVIGNYTMLSMVANATGVPLEERLPAMPEKSA